MGEINTALDYKNATDHMIDSLAQYLYDHYEIKKNWRSEGKPMAKSMEEKWKVHAISLINHFDKMMLG